LHEGAVFEVGEEATYSRSNNTSSTCSSWLRTTAHPSVLVAQHSCLEDAIDYYAAGGRAIADGPYQGVGRDNANKSPAIRGFT
jgi:hypothetical protein